jgi:hypothetical protein
VKYSQLSSGCIAQSILAFFPILGKLFLNISGILGQMSNCVIGTSHLHGILLAFLWVLLPFVLFKMLPKYMQNACDSNFVWSRSQTF